MLAYKYGKSQTYTVVDNQIVPILHKLSHSMENEIKLLNYLYETNVMSITTPTNDKQHKNENYRPIHININAKIINENFTKTSTPY